MVQHAATRGHWTNDYEYVPWYVGFAVCCLPPHYIWWLTVVLSVITFRLRHRDSKL